MAARISFMLKFILCDLLSFLFLHRTRVVHEFDDRARKIRCDRCGRYFMMDDYRNSVTPWSDWWEQTICETYQLIRTAK